MRCTSRIKGLTFTIKPGTKEAKTVPDCSIKFLDECFRIEKVDYPTASSVTAAIGAGGDKCTCGGLKKKKCKKCGCRICGGHEDENNQILCDECDAGRWLPSEVPGPVQNARRGGVVLSPV